MTVIVGFAERPDTGLLHNSVAFINASWLIEWVYRNVRCRPFESAEHGADFCVEGYICFDLEIPESIRSLQAPGAQLII